MGRAEEFARNGLQREASGRGRGEVGRAICEAWDARFSNYPPWRSGRSGACLSHHGSATLAHTVRTVPLPLPGSAWLTRPSSNGICCGAGLQHPSLPHRQDSPILLLSASPANQATARPSTPQQPLTRGLPRRNRQKAEGRAERDAWRAGAHRRARGWGGRAASGQPDGASLFTSGQLPDGRPHGDGCMPRPWCPVHGARRFRRASPVAPSLMGSTCHRFPALSQSADPDERQPAASRSPGAAKTSPSRCSAATIHRWLAQCHLY
ncbi:uncharacterized protein BDZ99DRAFT_480308 [Mytilinidion resinicola]|uniref:Uncharacterized protein n=1 Tax=Mytilinidion resinicola TaxID=574789 RepID=A0A6A6Y9X0_9PEZI|nr:uncharacterized protein BDZ99DRAFT_480308 [Mytilinidion resinicola]KAF2805622.1 hypothetical protein BDZ99DRAFT_480308 [Mytilinidion resinicola]